jgi:tetratricopeptide (TPR) repeat protein
MANALETVVETLERPRPRSARFVLAALALGAALLALAYLYGPAGGVPPGSEILVAAIDNRTGDETLDAIQTLLETELRQSPRFELVDDKRIGSALNRMGRASPELSDRKSSQEVAWRLAVPLVLTGTLQPVGSGYRLSLQLHMLGEASPTPTASWARDFTARDENEIYETVDAAGRWIRKTAGERRASIAQLDFPVREMTTPSWEALDLFYQAEELKQKDRWQDAILLLEEAVEADPDFAVAQMRLGDLKSSLKEVESYGHWERALDSLRRRRVSRREELNIRALYAIDTGSYLEAEPLYRKLSLLYPGDYRAAYYHGLTLRVLARYREALDRLLDAERKSPEPMYHVLVQIAGAHLALDDPSGASLYAEKLRAIDAPGWADAIQGAERFLRGEHEEAEAAFRGMTEGADLTMASWGYSLLAAALSERGRFDEAADALGRGIELDVKSGRPSTRAAKLLDLAQVLALQGKAEQARAACLQALELERGPHQMAIAGPLLARAGFPDDARNLLPELKPHRDKPLYRRAELLIEGEVHVARRKPGLALQVLHEAAALDRPEPKLYLARALRAAGHLEEAAAAYEEIVRSEGLVWMKRICDRPYPPGFFATALEEYAETAESVRLLNDQAARARERLLALRPDPGR